MLYHIFKSLAICTKFPKVKRVIWLKHFGNAFGQTRIDPGDSTWPSFRSPCFYPSLLAPHLYLASFSKVNVIHKRRCELCSWLFAITLRKRPRYDLSKIGRRQPKYPYASHPPLGLTPNLPVHCLQTRCHFILVCFLFSKYGIWGSAWTAPESLSFLFDCQHPWEGGLIWGL